MYFLEEMSEKSQQELVDEFQDLWSHLAPHSLPHPQSLTENINMSLFSQLEQRYCPETRDYRKYVNFLKISLQNLPYSQIFIGTFKALCLFPSDLSTRNSLNYLLLAIKELNLQSFVSRSSVDSTPPLPEQDLNHLVIVSFCFHSLLTQFLS